MYMYMYKGTSRVAMCSHTVETTMKYTAVKHSRCLEMQALFSLDKIVVNVLFVVHLTTGVHVQLSHPETTNRNGE